MAIAANEKIKQDKALKKAILGGDEAALQEFYEKYFSRLYRYVYYRVGHDHHHAEEVVNDTFIEALDKMDRFDPGRGSMEAWLITCSRNRIRSLNSLMGRAGTKETSWSMLDGELDTIFADIRKFSEQEEAMASEDLKNLVGLVMGSLPEEYGKLLEMKYVLDLSTRDIAGKLRKTEKAVESKLTRARAAFKQVFLSSTQDPLPI